jgi:hypothetical protein
LSQNCPSMSPMAISDLWQLVRKNQTMQRKRCSSVGILGMAVCWIFLCQQMAKTHSNSPNGTNQDWADLYHQFPK